MNQSAAASRLNRGLLALSLFLAMLITNQARAQQEAQVPEVQAQQEALVPDRPGFGDTPATVPRGFFLFEAGYNMIQDSSGDTDSAPELLLRAGVTPKLELRAGWDGYQWNGEDGALNSRIGFKLDALDQHGLVPELAIITEILLPTGDEQVAADGLEPELRFASGYDLTQTLSLSGNLNFADREGEMRNKQYFEFAGSFNVGLGITDALGTYVEYFGILPDDPASADNHSFGAGLTYVIGGNVQLDVFTNAGLDSDADDFSPGAGIAFVW